MANGVVELDLVLWREIYPQFDDMSDARVLYWWDVACTIVDNTPDSYVPEHARKPILYALLCHLCALGLRGPEGIGRTASATQGSVNVSLVSSLDQLKSGAWWNQTGCGATAYEMLKTYWIGGWYFNGGEKY